MRLKKKKERKRKSFGEGNGNPLQYSCLENPMDRGAWRATVYDTIEKLNLPKFVWLIYLFIFAISLRIQYHTIFLVNKYHMTLGIASC